MKSKQKLLLSLARQRYRIAELERVLTDIFENPTGEAFTQAVKVHADVTWKTKKVQEVREGIQGRAFATVVVDEHSSSFPREVFQTLLQIGGVSLDEVQREPGVEFTQAQQHEIHQIEIVEVMCPHGTPVCEPCLEKDNKTS